MSDLAQNALLIVGGFILSLVTIKVNRLLGNGDKLNDDRDKKVKEISDEVKQFREEITCCLNDYIHLEKVASELALRDSRMDAFEAQMELMLNHIREGQLRSDQRMIGISEKLEEVSDCLHKIQLKRDC